MSHPGTEVAMSVETMSVETKKWPAGSRQAALAMTGACEKCGGPLVFVGKLPAVRLQPLLQVYKCSPCNQIVTLRP